MEQDLSTKYTAIPLLEKQHQIILHKWVNDNTYPFKASMCRFFLRGMCIMKKQYCKFAHGMDDILEQQEQKYPQGINEKQRKKWEVSRKSFFNQKALFLCPLSYYNLYEFSKQISKKPLSLELLNQDFDVRNKLRIKFHRHQWQKFIEYLQKNYPNANITVPFLSQKYVKYGFCKPHTHCKIHMILFWIQQNNFYIRHDVMLPPLLDCKVSIIFKKYSKRPIDKLLLEDYQYQKQLQQQKESTPEIDRNKLNQDLIKQYINGKYVNEKTTICKFYMKGLCMFTEDECKFCHSFDTLKYIQRDYKIADSDFLEQKSLFSEPKLNYISLFRYQQVLMEKDNNHKFLSLQSLNKSAELRQDLRNVLHMDLYHQFLQKMEELYPNSNWTLSFLRKQYTNSGLNKTKVDKFPSFVDKLEELGYQMDTFIVPPYSTVKKQFVFKRPPLQLMNVMFSDLFFQIVCRRIEQSQQQECIVLTQQFLRKKFYQLQELFTIPLHRYLKIRNITMKQYIQQQLNSNENVQSCLNKVSFDLKGNVQRIKQTLKQYYNSNKRHQYQYSQILQYLKKNCEDSIRNYITANSLKWCIVGESLQLYKQIYLLPNGELMICSKKHQDTQQSLQCPCKFKTQNLKQQLIQIKDQTNTQQIIQQYKKQRVVIVDSFQTVVYSGLILQKIDIVGVDLEGNLREDGFIYLIQFGIKHPLTSQKQTFVFDIWQIRKDKVLLQKTLLPLKFVLENQNIIKVMHDCKNDSVALHYLLGICLYPVFDTCAMQVYFDQKQLNQNWSQKEEFIRGLFKIYNKTLGLNQVLQKYGRPINELKDSMKKMFEADKQVKQEYFQTRPIAEDFLQYAVRDVQELIDVYDSAIKLDENKIWKQIGYCASTMGLRQ